MDSVSLSAVDQRNRRALASAISSTVLSPSLDLRRTVDNSAEVLAGSARMTEYLPENSIWPPWGSIRRGKLPLSFLTSPIQIHTDCSTLPITFTERNIPLGGIVDVCPHCR